MKYSTHRSLQKGCIFFVGKNHPPSTTPCRSSQDMGDDAAALFAALTLRCGQLRTLRSLFVTEETGFLGEDWKDKISYTFWVDVCIRRKMWEMIIYGLVISVAQQISTHGCKKSFEFSTWWTYESTPCILWHPLVHLWCFSFSSWQLTNVCFGYTPAGCRAMLLEISVSGDLRIPLNVAVVGMAQVGFLCE